MTVVERVQKIVASLSDGTSVLVSISELKEWLREAGDRGPPPPPIAFIADLTAEQIGVIVGRSPSTVRGWLNSGLIPEGYKLNGHEWRVSRDALEAFQNRQREGVSKREPRRPKLPPTLDAWRSAKAGGVR